MVLAGLLAGMVHAAPRSDSGETEAMANALHQQLARAFVLPQALPLDPALREQATAMAAAHIAHMRTLFPAWIQEERKIQSAGGKKPDAQSVYHAVWARLLNETALWHITPGDAAYEKATLDAVTTAPLACHIYGETRFSDYASRIARVQTMAPALRQAVLASERSLLERWGSPHANVAPYPEPAPQVAGMAALARMRAGGTPPPRALPPALASSLLSAGGAYEKAALETRCQFQQWWLRVNLAQGMAPAVALSAFRYGTMITAANRVGDWFDGPDKAPDQPGSYPAMARRFQVTGDTMVTRSMDAAGKPVATHVSGRNITVPGIRGVRPIAFESSFDAPAHSAALQRDAGAGMPPSTLEYKMVWALPDAPSTAKGTTP